ncbi:MAG: hypothetical protein ACREER_00580 [Alphaproteobacteria bacterium]
MPRLPRTWIAIVLALSAGCAGPGVRSVPGAISGQNPVEVLRYLARGPDVRATIVGNPTAASTVAFEDAVTAAMNERTWLPPVNFTARPTSEASSGYRVVMAFGAPETVGARALCAAEAPAYAVPAGSGRLQAAFCWEDRVLSRASVTVEAITDATDPRLHAAVRTATRELFPLNPVERPDHDNCGQMLCS